jgi:hypothetical protein
MSKAKYITVHRIETRDKTGKEKKVIKPGTEMDLTAAEAKKYGAAVQKVEKEEPEEVEPASGGDGE